MSSSRKWLPYDVYGSFLSTFGRAYNFCQDAEGGDGRRTLLAARDEGESRQQESTHPGNFS